MERFGLGFLVDWFVFVCNAAYLYGKFDTIAETEDSHGRK